MASETLSRGREAETDRFLPQPKTRPAQEPHTHPGPVPLASWSLCYSRELCSSQEGKPTRFPPPMGTLNSTAVGYLPSSPTVNSLRAGAKEVFASLWAYCEARPGTQ